MWAKSYCLQGHVLEIWSESRPYPRGPPRLELRNQRKLPWRPACCARYIIRTRHYAHPARATPGAHAAPPPALIGPKMASKQPSSRRSFDPPRSELTRLYQTYSMQEIAEHYGVGETMGGRVPKTGRLYLQYAGTPFVLPSSATGGSHLGNSGSIPLGYWATEHAPLRSLSRSFAPSIRLEISTPSVVALPSLSNSASV